MKRRPDDKSAQEAYYMPEGAQNHVASDHHINPLAQGAAPQSHPYDQSLENRKTSTNTKPFAWARIPPRRIAFCGGGVRCVAHVGVMRALSKANLLIHLKEMIGISAGALFSLLFVLDYSLDEIQRLSLEFDFTVLRNIDPDDAFLFPFTLGLDSGNALERLIESILRQKGFSADTTFAELERGCSLLLRCYAMELQTANIREFSAATTPDTKVVFAIRATMSVPILYTPVKDPSSNILLVDGGILHNLPLVFLKEAEIVDTIAVMFIRGKTAISEEIHFLDMIKHVYNSITIMRNVPYLEKYKDNIICVETSEYSTFNFEESAEGRKRLIERARKSTETFLCVRRPPARRFSAA